MKTTAGELRDALGAREHCIIEGRSIDAFPTRRFYLNEEFIDIDHDRQRYAEFMSLEATNR